MAKRKLVASLLTEHQEFQLAQAADARAAAERAGYPIDVVFAESNGVVQIQQLFRYIHAPEEERPLALLVEPVVGEGFERVARNAVAAGIGWVLLNAWGGYLDTLRASHPRLAISSVTGDQVEAGRIQARQFRALLPGGGNLLYVQGPTDSSAAADREQGMRAGLEGSAIQVKAVVGDWTEAGGEKAVASWLRLKTSEQFRPDVVGCQNDSLAVGARRAIQKHRPEWSRLPFTGCDGLPEGGQRLVMVKQLAATIVVSSNAGTAVDLVVRCAEKGQPPPPRIALEPRSFPPLEELASRAAG